MAGLIQELKRRNVFKVGTAYAVMAWLVAQVADIFLEPLGVPEWFIQSLLILLLIGFPVTLIFAWVYELTPEGIKKEKDVDRTQSITGKTGQKLNRTIIAVLVLAVAVLLFDRVRPKDSDAPASAAAMDGADVVVTQTSAEPSIAVLPFVDMSPNRDQDYFSDGISEEILNALAKVKELKVAGRTSSFAYKGMNQDLREIGETLNVDHILEGSVRTAGNKVRITAQLIQVEDGFHLWSETYDRVLDDVFAIQDEIANAILEQMKSNLLEEVEQVATTSKTDPEVYEQYLMARQRMYTRSEAGLQSAHELLDEVIAKDPEYAPAYALRGITTLLLADDSYGTIPRDQSLTQGKIYLDRALSLDPNSAEALAGLGLWANQDPRGLEQGVEYLERALAINPNLIDASNWLQQAYAGLEQPLEAQRILEEMFEKDPFYRPGFSNLVNNYSFFNRLDDIERVMERVRPMMQGDVFYLNLEAVVQALKGELAEATRTAERSLALRPNHATTRLMLGLRFMDTAQWERMAELDSQRWMRVLALQKLNRLEEATLLATQMAAEGEEVNSLWAIYMETGRPELVAQFFNERWASLDAFLEDFPPTPFQTIDALTNLAVAFRAVDNPEQFEQALQRARDMVQKENEIGYRHGVLSIMHAQYYTVAGDYEAALEHIEQAFELGNSSSGDLGLWYLLEPLRGDPRYQAIDAQMREKVNSEREKLGLEALEA